MTTHINCPKCNEEVKVFSFSLGGSIKVKCSKRHRIEYKGNDKGITLVSCK